jgi:4-amino-4-deoxy-L-arabinose transferase-like glycosyltransferase
LKETRETGDSTPEGKLLRGHRLPLALAATVALALFIYLRDVPENPPGFFVDESSIAFNAHSISQSGADEHGARWPLYFRAFGEYKSPVYIYLLAALFKLTGPSITAARLLSAVCGLSAAALLGLLSWRMTRRRMPVFVVFVSAMLTPWLFELSRLVFEVALFPSVLALFLLAVHAAAAKEEWSWPRAATLGATLGLLTYTYSAGRLLAPLFALGLALFITRGRLRGVVRAWLAYGATLVPLLIFNSKYPGALGSRFTDVSYVTPESTWAGIALRFVGNYLGNFNPLSWLVAGDPEPRHHLPGMGSLLAPTFILAATGFALVLVRKRREAWWRFVLYGLAVSAVPAALTLDHFHTLRLAALVVFLCVLIAPAIEWLCEAGAGAKLRRAALAVLVLLTLAQGALFQWQFSRAAETRWHNFDTFYPEVFSKAVELQNHPIYILDNHAAPGYMHAYWYATLRRVDLKQFVRLGKGEQPPPGALVISTEMPCTRCRMILERGSFRLYIAD